MRFWRLLMPILGIFTDFKQIPQELIYNEYLLFYFKLNIIFGIPQVFQCYTTDFELEFQFE